MTSTAVPGPATESPIVDAPGDTPSDVMSADDVLDGALGGAPNDGDPGGDVQNLVAGDEGPSMSLPFVALVLGISATVLGLTVVWFFAAIPLGIAAVVVAVMAQQRGAEGRHHTRAILGLVLGTVGVLLGITGAIFMPRIVARLDSALTNAENSVTDDIKMIDDSVSSDVNRLDRTMSRDLRRLERSNRENLLQFERATSESLTKLEQRIAETAGTLSAAEKQDLARLEQELRRDLDALDASLRTTDSGLVRDLALLEARVAELERRLGI